MKHTYFSLHKSDEISLLKHFVLQMLGTAEQSRMKVRNYFHELRETLNRQELVALTTVDNHIREKLCMLRQQQEDMTVLLSQISAVCHQCEFTLQSVSFIWSDS